MTIAISIKVNDGIVLAADSASTILQLDQNGQIVGSANVYNNANKIVNLYKGLPIGVVTWGLGAIGVSSMATLMKDMRKRLRGKVAQGEGWEIDENNYTIEDVAQKFFRFIYEQRYVPAFQGQRQVNPLGCFVAGYSSNEEMAEEFLIEIKEDGTCPGPERLQPRADSDAISWYGQRDTIFRILFGYGEAMPEVLKNDFGIPDNVIDLAMEILRKRLSIRLVNPAMPIQDVIDLADFLATASAQVSRFVPETTSVGGPIEVAAITKHEGFKWIKRKYYYDRAFNPEENQ